jgi:hypothetical protein
MTIKTNRFLKKNNWRPHCLFGATPKKIKKKKKKKKKKKTSHARGIPSTYTAVPVQKVQVKEPVDAKICPKKEKARDEPPDLPARNLCRVKVKRKGRLELQGAGRRRQRTRGQVRPRDLRHKTHHV